MEYPTLYVKDKSRQMSDAFLGYNHNLRINESEFYDMKNMTSDYSPVLSPRKNRGYKDISTAVNGIIAKDNLCWVTGNDFMIGNEGVDLGLTDGPKELISMGAYVIIMPDKKWVNTIKDAETGEYEHGSLNELFETEAETTLSLCDRTGDDYDADKIKWGFAPPLGEKKDDGTYEIENGQMWIDASAAPQVLKKYSSANKMWATVETYVKITSTGIGENFNVYDGVTISGIVEDVFGGNDSLNGRKDLYGCDKNYVIIKGFLWKSRHEQGNTNNVDTEITQSAENKITISRKMPDLDFITECNNRLWGCKYGPNSDGEVVNEIYASKLGDFKNWNCFMGVSTDSYRASCGSDGPFTGAITHMGYPLFFKENGLHKVYGDYPSNFGIQYTPCRGVQKNSHKSLAIVGETLFYKSGNAVCAYDGSLPVEISTALGNVRYYNAVAGAHGNKYYINMRGEGNIYHLFVYDAAKGMWHKEDNIRVDAFCSHMDELYAIDHETKHIITMLSPGDVPDAEPVPWMVETGIWGMSMPDMKYISKLLIRISLEVGATVEVSIQYDSVGDWEQVCRMTATSLRSFSIPVRPRRCDHFRIRIEGVGQGKIYSITKTIEQGSDIS